MVSIYIRLANAEKVCFDLDIQSSIKELKNVISKSQNVEADLITLVFKGKILKDEQTLEASGLIEGSIIHMVVMKKKATASTPKPASVSNSVETTPKVAEKASSEKVEEKEQPKQTFPSLNLSSIFNPLGGASTQTQSPFSRAGGLGGLGGMADLDNLPINKEASKGLFDFFKQNPDRFIEMMKTMDPGFQNVLEKNPQMEAMLHDPATLDYLFDMMSDPESRKNAMRQADNAIHEISNIPGGEAMLDRVLSQYYEPLDKEKDSKNFDKSVSTSSSSTAPQETTLPNLWGSTPAPSSNPFQRATTTPSNYANLFGASGANPNPSMGSEMELVRQLVSTNPEMVSSLLKMTPEYQNIAKTNPEVAEMMSNPEYLKQAFTPEVLQIVQQLQGNSNFGGFGGLHYGQPQQLTNEQIRERYATQITQIEEMGFVVDDNVLQVLHRFQGNVESTINFLIS